MERFFKALLFLCLTEASAACAVEKQELWELQSILLKDTAHKVYGAMNTLWAYPHGSESMEVGAKAWKMGVVHQAFLQDGKPMVARMHTFILNEEPQNICQALDCLVASPAKVDCSLALLTAQVFMVRALMGDSLFTQYATLTYVALPNKETFFSALPREFLRVSTSVSAPYFCHLTNVAAYTDLCPQGYDRGHNVFCLASDTYIGFGQMFKDGPKTEYEIAQSFFQSYMEQVEIHRLRDPSVIITIHRQPHFHTERDRRQSENQARIFFVKRDFSMKGLSSVLGDLMLAGLDP